MASGSPEAPQEVAGVVTTPAPAPARSKLKLYSFWRSSCSQRVRIALNLKGLAYEYKPVNLLANEQSDPEFEKLNPIKYVPALVDGDAVIADSFAIFLYLEDKYPQHPLLPQDPEKKALNIQGTKHPDCKHSRFKHSTTSKLSCPCEFAQTSQNFIEKFDSHETIKSTQHHINRGFTALEKLLKGCTTKYATGDEIEVGDLFLEPQINGGIKRFGIDMSNYPTLARLHEAYMEQPAFQAALPEKQPDAPSS